MQSNQILFPSNPWHLRPFTENEPEEKHYSHAANATLRTANPEKRRCLSPHIPNESGTGTLPGQHDLTERLKRAYAAQNEEQRPSNQDALCRLARTCLNQAAQEHALQLQEEGEPPRSAPGSRDRAPTSRPKPLRGRRAA